MPEENLDTTLRLDPHLGRVYSSRKGQASGGGFSLVTTKDSRPLIGHSWPGQAEGLVWITLVFADSASDSYFQCSKENFDISLVTTGDSRPLIGHSWPGQAAGWVWINLVFAHSDSDRVIFSFPLDEDQL